MQKHRPYLYFSETEKQTLRQKFNDPPFQYKWGEMQKNANAMLARDFFAKRLRQDNLSAIRYVEGIIAVTGFVYALTGEQKYGKRAVDELLMVARMDWRNFTEITFYNKGANLSTATLALAIALVYDWCHDLLSESEKQEILTLAEDYCLAEYTVSCAPPVQGNIYHGVHNVENEEKRDFWVENPCSNWCGVVHGGIGVLCMAIYNESEKARTCLTYAKKYLPAYLDSCVPADGGGEEGVMYAQYGWAYALKFLAAAERFWGDDFGLFAKLTDRQLGYWDLYMLAPDAKFANFNDMDEYTMCCWQLMGTHEHIRPSDLEAHMRFDIRTGSNADIFALLESKKPETDAVLLWQADYGHSLYKWEGVSPFYMIWRRGQTPPPVHKPLLEDFKVFPASGYAVMRQDKMWLAIRSGKTPDCAHHHFDLGTFILVYDQYRIICDPGYGEKKSSQHSTYTLDGEDQWECGYSNFTEARRLGNHKYIVCDITGGYFNREIRCIRRHFVMLADDALIIMDEIHARNPVKPESYLQTRHPLRVENADNIYVDVEPVPFKISAQCGVPLTVSAIDNINHRTKEHYNSIQFSIDQPTDEWMMVTAIFPNQNNRVLRVESNGIIVLASNDKNYILTFVNKSARWHLDKIET